MPGTLTGILIVAQPGRMLTSLCVLLRSCLPNQRIEHTEDVATLLQHLAGEAPWLVLVDANLPEEMGWRLRAEIESDHPRRRAVLLVHDTQQRERASASGLDFLPLDGITAGSLSAVFHRYFS